ncbi:PorP/SprF family type IX secretion system membrane protein [Rufibacter soli]
MSGRNFSCLTLLFVCGVCLQANGQQKAQFSQYMTNSLVINPAVAGIENYMDIRSSYRKQWVGVEGSPTTFYTSVHASIGKSDRNAQGRGKISPRTSKKGVNVNKNNKFHRVRPHHGVGAMVQIDQAGLLKTSTVNLMYAFHLPLTSTINLSSGISGGVLRNSFNTGQARAIDPSDASLAGEMINMTKADVSIGTWLYTTNAFLGISAAQLLNSSSDFKAPVDHVLSGRLVPHYFVTAGYRLKVNDLTLIPSVLYKKSNPGTGAIDLNLKTMYNDRIWLGVSYRDKDAVVFLFGLNVSHILDVGYSYDLPTSSQLETSAGSHELMLGIKVNNKNKVFCPEWIW